MKKGIVILCLVIRVEAKGRKGEGWRTRLRFD